MSEKDPESPPWYDESKLARAYYVVNEYTGWVVDNGDGTCHFANEPLLGEDGPKWGDKVRLIKNQGPLPIVDWSVVLEKYVPDPK